MAIPSKCPACKERLTLPDKEARTRFKCPACGIALATTEYGDLVVEAVRRSAGPGLPEPMDGAPAAKRDESEDEWDEQIPSQHLWMRRRYRREAALNKVRAPAIYLQVAGVLMILGAVALAVLTAVLPSASNNKNDDDWVAMTVLFAVGSAISLMLGIANFFAGTRMKALRSYGAVLGIVITTLILGAMFCIFMAVLPIWPLTVLVNSEVRAGFEMTKKESQKPDSDRKGQDSA